MRKRSCGGFFKLLQSAEVVKWQTRTFEGRVAQAVRVQVPPSAPSQSWAYALSPGPRLCGQCRPESLVHSRTLLIPSVKNHWRGWAAMRFFLPDRLQQDRAWVCYRAARRASPVFHFFPFTHLQNLPTQLGGRSTIITGPIHHFNTNDLDLFAIHRHLARQGVTR